MLENSVNHNLIKRLIDSWPKRAGVRYSGYYTQQDSTYYNRDIPDYPIELLPFHNHPTFIDATPEQQQKILTWAWLIYNERVVTAEEYVANPAFTMLVQGVFPGISDYSCLKALKQCLIDEHFHSLIHMTAIKETKKVREVDSKFHCSPSIIYRKLLETQYHVSDGWQKDLLTLIWTIVSEISINAYLSLLSTNDSIQPMHKKVVWLHNRDELAHSQIMVEITKLVYINLNAEQKRFFIDVLPKALNAFAAHDLSAWNAILKHIGFEGFSQLIEDCGKKSSQDKLVRDFSDIKRLAEELDILSEVDFEFEARNS